MTPTTHPKLCDHALERDLREHLLAVNFHACLHAVAQLLTNMGYQEVALAGRIDRRGRRAEGGCDLVAYQPVPGGKRRVIVQVKQYPERPVFRRAVDELRGVCLRAGASEAILITTSTFSPRLEPGRLATALVAPVRLIDGQQLAELMVLHQVGAWVQAPSSPTEPAIYGVDERFFTELSQVYGNSRLVRRTRGLDIELSLTLRPHRRIAKAVVNTKKATLPRRS